MTGDLGIRHRRPLCCFQDRHALGTTRCAMRAAMRLDDESRASARGGLELELLCRCCNGQDSWVQLFVMIIAEAMRSCFSTASTRLPEHPTSQTCNASLALTKRLAAQRCCVGVQRLPRDALPKCLGVRIVTVPVAVRK